MITIFEELDRDVGILDGMGSPEEGNLMRGAGCLRSIMAAPAL